MRHLGEETSIIYAVLWLIIYDLSLTIGKHKKKLKMRNILLTTIQRRGTMFLKNDKESLWKCLILKEVSQSSWAAVTKVP